MSLLGRSALISPGLFSDIARSYAVRARWFGRAIAAVSDFKVEGCQNISLAGKGGRFLEIYRSTPNAGCKVGPLV